MPLKKEKRLTLAGIDVSVALDAQRAERVVHSAPYRYAVRPALHWLARQRAAAQSSTPSSVSQPANAPASMNGVAARRSPQADALLERVAEIEWYHTIDLPHGVTTPGWADHREQVQYYGLPADMRGMRALDIATFDGFWAFEMERRGADVVAIDIESWAQIDFPRKMLEAALTKGAKRPTGPGFALAREQLGSRVDRQLCSVYDLSPERVGTFDVVFVSDLLLHLRDPQRALESMFSVTRNTGYALVAEPYDQTLEAFKDVALSSFRSYWSLTWWLPSTNTLKAMMQVAGYEEIEEISRFRLKCNSDAPLQKVVLKGYPKREPIAPTPPTP